MHKASRYNTEENRAEKERLYEEKGRTFPWMTEETFFFLLKGKWKNERKWKHTQDNGNEERELELWMFCVFLGLRNENENKSATCMHLRRKMLFVVGGARTWRTFRFNVFLSFKAWLNSYSHSHVNWDFSRSASSFFVSFSWIAFSFVVLSTHDFFKWHKIFVGCFGRWCFRKIRYWTAFRSH